MLKKPTGKLALTYLFIIFNGMLCALSYRLFVFPNKFAPAGIGGITTMVQYIFNINVGYLTLLINVPLAFCLSRFTAMPIVPLYAICLSTDLIKCVLGAIMIRQGKWIQNLTQ